MTKGAPTPDQAQGDLFDDTRQSDERLASKKLKTKRGEPTTSAPKRLSETRFFSIEQVAERYGVGKTTVYRWVAKWLECQLFDFERNAFLKTSVKKSKVAKRETRRSAKDPAS
jgi:hypothetical protein